MHLSRVLTVGAAAALLAVALPSSAAASHCGPGCLQQWFANELNPGATSNTGFIGTPATHRTYYVEMSDPNVFVWPVGVFQKTRAGANVRIANDIGIAAFGNINTNTAIDTQSWCWNRAASQVRFLVCKRWYR